MNKIIYLYFCFLISLLSLACRNEKQAETPASVESKSKALKSDDPLVIQFPDEYYSPAGLRPLNIVEMYNYGKDNADGLKAIPLKNKHGETISQDVLNDPEKPVFMQMYADQEGRIIEAVVFELNDTIKNLMMNMRKSNK